MGIFIIFFLVGIPFAILARYLAERTQSVFFPPVFSAIFVLTSYPLYLKFHNSFEFYYFSFLLILLLGTAYVDFLTEGIPQLFTHSGIVLGVVFSYFTKFPGLKNSLIGAAVGIALFLLVKFLADMMMRKESFGLGDVKLLTMIGAFGGPYLLLTAFIGGSFLGAFFGLIKYAIKGDNRLPFGPFISIAAYLGIVFRENILSFVRKILVA